MYMKAALWVCIYMCIHIKVQIIGKQKNLQQRKKNTKYNLLILDTAGNAVVLISSRHSDLVF